MKDNQIEFTVKTKKGGIKEAIRQTIEEFQILAAGIEIGENDRVNINIEAAREYAEGKGVSLEELTPEERKQFVTIT